MSVSECDVALGSSIHVIAYYKSKAIDMDYQKLIQKVKNFFDKSRSLTCDMNTSGLGSLGF